MLTLEEFVCARWGCSKADFVNRAFSHCLPPSARVWVPLVSRFERDFFQPDREFIEFVGRVATMQQLDAEISEFMSDHRNLPWLRRWAKVRIVTKRVRAMAKAVLTPQPEKMRRT